MYVSYCDPCEAARSVFSRERLADRCMGKLELVDRLVRILAEGLPRDTAEIEAAVDSEEIDRVASLAHRLKGAAANMCAERLSLAAAGLEQAARVCDAEGISESWHGLQREAGLLLEALKRQE